mmetsp:Transcript_13387/g.53705  ORF Transcript_13387/g.53705 Transcript_13387/m.53705 type:complete len:210 (+) Transcript_13387:813-1442(+)
MSQTSHLVEEACAAIHRHTERGGSARSRARERRASGRHTPRSREGRWRAEGGHGLETAALTPDARPFSPAAAAPFSGTRGQTGSGRASSGPKSASARTLARSHSLTRAPSTKTSTSTSSSRGPLTVVSAPSSVLTSASLPFLEILPLSVMGSLKTSRSTPSTTTAEHLKAHFCVSRLSFCSSPPPEPKARLSADQPLSLRLPRMSHRVS